MKNYNKKDNKKVAEKMKTLTCTVDWEIKSITKSADGDMFIEGFANTADKDRIGDVVLPSAFANTMKEYMENPVILFQHNWDNVIGQVTEFKIVDEEAATVKGLWIKVKLSKANDVADVVTKIKEGSLRTFSIGYNELDSDFDGATETNIIKELELLEISVVTIPCNPFAKFTTSEGVAKGLDDGVIDFLAMAIKDLKDPKDATSDFLKQVIEIYTSNAA